VQHEYSSSEDSKDDDADAHWGNFKFHLDSAFCTFSVTTLV